MRKNKVRQYIPRIEANTNKEMFTVPQLVRQIWFPIKSVITLRKLIDTGKLPAHLSNSNLQTKRYLIYKEDALRYLNSKDYGAVKSKQFRVNKDYFSLPTLIKQDWFPVKSLVTLNKLIAQEKIKAVNAGTNPSMRRYHIHKDEVIRYMTTLIYKSLRNQ
jgi:hypothetical protein